MRNDVAVRRASPELARTIAAIAEREPREQAFRSSDPASIARAIERLFADPYMPERGASVAVTTSQHKTAALFFDRVWGPAKLDLGIPKQLLAWGATDFEITFTSLGAAGADDLGLRLTRDLMSQVGEAPLRRSIASELASSYGVIAVPVFQSDTGLRSEYAPGRTEVLLAAISSLELVDDRRLSWDQVVDFRADKASRRDYRRMLNWIDQSMVGRTAQQIADEIGDRLDRYNRALRKHGVGTVAGVVESLIDPKFISATTVATGAVALTSEFVATLLTAVSLIGTRIACTLTKRTVDTPDARSADTAVVAYVLEIQRKLS